MDVVRLNPTTFLPDTLIEGYNTMIWTERYSPNGEFQMKTPLVPETRALIPEGSYISLMDSSEVMLVETHSIDVDDKGDRELSITGSTFETILSDRMLIPTVYGEQWDTLQLYTLSQIVSMLIWSELVNSTGQDVTRAATLRDTITAISNLVVTDSSTTTDAAAQWFLDKGEAYAQIQDFMLVGGLGLRNIRPMNTTGNVMTFDTSGAPTRGTPSKVSTPNLAQLRMDVYNGVDRTRQNSSNPVIFHYEAGDIESPKYLFSVKDLKNMARIVTSTGNIDIWPTTGTTPPVPAPSGADLRMLYVDGGDEGDQDHDEFVAASIQKGLIELSKHNRAFIFDGSISPISSYKYNQHYSLGDKVTLMAEYGYEATMMVSEYIRTEDHDGDRGYPTLSLSS